MSSPRKRLLLGFAWANLALIIVATSVWLSKPAAPPLIQGVLLQNSRALDDFILLDHNGQAFINKHLQGAWHIVSYGFTHCPDVCPTTLSTLAQVASKLAAEGREPLNVLFYSVDHRRDTATELASYMPFFNESFLGLTHLDDSSNPHLPFEQGLGIFAQLSPDDSAASANDSAAYQVSHGISLLLLNPQGQLQAIFKPGENQLGVKVFDPDTLYRDYLKIRFYYDTPVVASATP
ncbi:MAG: SCO family protein [Halioglobus sp.]